MRPKSVDIVSESLHVGIEIRIHQSFDNSVECHAFGPGLLSDATTVVLHGISSQFDELC